VNQIAEEFLLMDLPEGLIIAAVGALQHPGTEGTPSPHCDKVEAEDEGEGQKLSPDARDFLTVDGSDRNASRTDARRSRTVREDVSSHALTFDKDLLLYIGWQVG
jgi:hypothetical protein